MRVVVIGAGLSGLGAAWRLFRQGCDVVVVERRPEAGGAAVGRVEEGFCIDAGLEVLHSRSRRLVSFMGDLGLADRLLPLRPVRIGQICGGDARSIDPASLSGIARIPGVRWYDVPKLMRFERLMNRYRPLLDSEFPERAASLDYRSVADFGRLYFGATLLDHWIGPMAIAHTSGDPAELSRVAFLSALANAEGVAPGLARRGLREVARHAAEQLAVRVDVEAEKVEPMAEGFRVHCNAARGSEAIDADAVVVACGAAAAAGLTRELAVPAERDFFAQVAYSPRIVVSVALDRPLTGVPLLVRVPGCEGSGVAVHLVEPGSAGGRVPTGCGLLTAVATEAFSLANRDTDDEVVLKSLLADLERWYPRISGVLQFARVTRRDEATPRFEVGAYRAIEQFRRVETDRREQGRRLYYAGGYLAGPDSEAAYESGLRAADAVFQDFG